MPLLPLGAKSGGNQLMSPQTMTWYHLLSLCFAQDETGRKGPLFVGDIGISCCSRQESSVESFDPDFCGELLPHPWPLRVRHIIGWNSQPGISLELNTTTTITIYVQSTEESGCTTGAFTLVVSCHLFQSLHFPHLHGCVRTGRGNLGSPRNPRYTVHTLLVSIRHLEPVSRVVQAPDKDVGVQSSACHVCAALIPGKGCDSCGVRCPTVCDQAAISSLVDEHAAPRVSNSQERAVR